MANCAIYQIGSDSITYFLNDCTQTGRDFKGSNLSVSGVKEHLFDAKWTTTIATPILDAEGNVIGYDKRVSELSPALEYRGRVVSTKTDVDAVTRSLIAEKYSDSDEKKLLRLKLSGDSTGWNEYQSYVESLVQQGRAFKKQMEE